MKFVFSSTLFRLEDICFLEGNRLNNYATRGFISQRALTTNPVSLKPPTKLHQPRLRLEHFQPRAIDNSPFPQFATDSPTMPREVSDIKQFIEICRRKDAKCEILRSILRDGFVLITFSWTHKAQPTPDQVQSSMLAVHVYTCVEGFGKGG